MRKIAAVIIDTFADKAPALMAIRRTLRLANVSNLYMIADAPFYPGAVFHQIPAIRSMNHYSDVVLRILPELITEDHFLLIQWDGMPAFPQHWNEGFLEYDYIGAPWIGADGQLRVGNGGFSLRSRRLLEACRSLHISVDLGDPTHQAEDLLMCITHRSRLEELGIRFAPVEVAKRFSFESGNPTIDVFGFHSTFNFPYFLPESELLGFAERIVQRQTNLNVLLPYLENLLRVGMHDLLRLSLAAIYSRPTLAGEVARTAIARHLQIGKVFAGSGVQITVRTSSATVSAGAPVVPARIENRRRGDPGRRRTQTIPQTIFQTFKVRDLPPAMGRAVHSWIDRNPDYDHEFFDDDGIAAYIGEEFSCSDFSFDRDTLMRAYQKIKAGAGKADIFRYLIIYERGGVYMDIDTTCLVPLSEFIEPEDEVVSGIGGRGDFHQWGLIYVSRHPFIKQAIERTVSNILNETFAGGRRSLEGLGGPPCLDLAIKDVLQLPAERRFGPGRFQFEKDGRAYVYRLLDGDFFGNRVDFKYPEYLSDLRRMNMTHWTADELFNTPQAMPGTVQV